MEVQTAPKGLDEKYCGDCGKVIKVKAEICPHCGVRQRPAPSATEKNKFVAAILALFLGGIGIHKFYLGQQKAGIFYLLFCWTFIPALLALVDAIALLVMSESKFNERYA